MNLITRQNMFENNDMQVKGNKTCASADKMYGSCLTLPINFYRNDARLTSEYIRLFVILHGVT